MDPKTKTFDCVEMKRRGAEEVRRRLEGLTREEELAHWARGTKEFIDWQKKQREAENRTEATERSD
jgi:hypothetical protein